MAIYGELQDHTLTDILNVLRSRSGTLFLDRACEGRTAELTLSVGTLTALYLDGFPVPLARVPEVFTRLGHSQEGTFEFRPHPEHRAGAGFLHLPLAELRRWTTQGLSQDAELPEERLPHPATRFVLRGEQRPGGPGSPDTVPLAVPWANLYAALAQGGSAEGLAAALSLPLPRVRTALAQLRDLNLIAPVRAGAQPGAQARMAWSGFPAPDRSVMTRLVGALRRFAAVGTP